MCGPEGIENGYEGVVDPDDERELPRGGRFSPGAKPASFSGYEAMINILCLRVIVYFQGQVSRPLYAVAAVALLCGPLPLDRVLGTCQFHATWVEGFRKAWFLLQSAAKIISWDPMTIINAMGMEGVNMYGMKKRSC